MILFVSVLDLIWAINNFKDPPRGHCLSSWRCENRMVLMFRNLVAEFRLELDRTASF